MADAIEQEKMDGSPATIKLEGTVIKFQLGPVKEVGKNGVQIDDLINVCLARLRGFQNGPFKCRENSVQITKLEEALMWGLWRTQKRSIQGVEGLNKVHAS